MEQGYEISTNNSQNQWQNNIDSKFWDIDDNDEELSDILGKTLDLGKTIDLGKTLDDTKMIDELEQPKDDHYNISEVDYKPSDLLWGTLYETKLISEPEQKINDYFDRREFGDLSIVR